MPFNIIVTYITLPYKGERGWKLKDNIVKENINGYYSYGRRLDLYANVFSSRDYKQILKNIESIRENNYYNWIFNQSDVKERKKILTKYNIKKKDWFRHGVFTNIDSDDYLSALYLRNVFDKKVVLYPDWNHDNSLLTNVGIEEISEEKFLNILKGKKDV